MIFRSVARRVVPKKLLRYFRQPWVTAEPRPPSPSPIDPLVLYAIIGTWMESDIIEATVANAFCQGADRVFIIDNDSPDDTVSRAKKAGAEHVRTYKTQIYDEAHRIKLMNEFVSHASFSSQFDHVWWLWLDADEFPRPRAGGTLRNLLQSLDRKFRVVGARFLNHYPSPKRWPYVVGQHPIDYQPLCEELRSGMCWQGHRKHSLMRWDRNGPAISASKGFHQVICDSYPLLEPLEPFIIHHFPFREEQATRLRMQELWAGKQSGMARAREADIAVVHMKARLKSLDAVYAGDWRNVSTLQFEELKQGVSLTHWGHLLPDISNDIPRWYVPNPRSQEDV